MAPLNKSQQNKRVPKKRLRVAFLAGTLGQGGAEKQLVYIVQGLLEAGVDVRVYSLTQNEFYEPALKSIGISPIWIGKSGNIGARLVTLAKELRTFRPHILQAAHFYVNLYVSLIAPLYRAISIGAVRNDLKHEMDANGRWGPWLVRLPNQLLANSYAAKDNIPAIRDLAPINPDRMHVLPNVIDLEVFDRRAAENKTDLELSEQPTVMTVCRLVPMKRLNKAV
ncbi:MAG: glycosyltransferase [Chloroflexota bacterium]